MECWSTGELKRSNGRIKHWKDGVMEYWSTGKIEKRIGGVMVDEEEQEQGLSEVAGVEQCRGILQANMGGVSEASL